MNSFTSNDLYYHLGKVSIQANSTNFNIFRSFYSLLGKNVRVPVQTRKCVLAKRDVIFCTDIHTFLGPFNSWINDSVVGTQAECLIAKNTKYIFT